MPEENKPVETPPEGTETGSETETDVSTLSHEDALSALTAARAEAANSRVQLRDTKKLYEEAQAKLADAKSQEDIEAIRSEHAAKVAELEHTILTRDIAAEHKLPADLADALKGATKEELEAHAKVLAKYIPGEEQEAPPGELGGGVAPGSKPSDIDSLGPRELAARARGRRG